MIANLKYKLQIYIYYMSVLLCHVHCIYTW